MRFDRTRVALFVLLFASYAYFYQAGGWNQNSRFSLVRAITNEHSLRIDPFKNSTGDIAVFGGHYYSDKAPGVAFLAAPFVFVVRPFLRAIGGDPESYEGIAFLSWLGTALTSGLFAALAGVALFNICLHLGAPKPAALFAVIVYGLGSPMWPLATLFLGHALSAACLVLAFALGSDVKPRGFWVGIAGGWATVTEFPAAVPAAILGLFAVWQASRTGRRPAIQTAASVTAGALLCAAILMGYQYACFGSPFHIAYTSEQGFDAMQQGLFGINTPTIDRLIAILFGLYRGLLPLAPALAFAPFGFAVLYLTNRPARPAVITAAAIALYYIGLNASYTYWEGGWSYGPRHLSPAIPFLAIGVAFFWTIAPPIGRVALSVLAAIGIGLSVVAVSTMAQPPADIQRPLTELLVPAFNDGDLALNPQRFTDRGANSGALRAHTTPKAASNVGMKMGLRGRASLIPLIAVWIVCWYLLRSARSRMIV